MVKSKPNAQACFLIAFTLLFITLSAYLLLHPEIPLRIPAPVAGLLLLIPSLLLCYILARHVQIVTVEENGIILKGIAKTTRIAKTEIKRVVLFSTEDFYWVAGLTTIGTRIELVNGKRIVITDPLYSGMHLIKQALVSNFPEKISPAGYLKETMPASSEPEAAFTRFAGHPLTSLNGLLFLAIAIVIPFFIFYNNQYQPAHIFLLIPVAIFYFGFGRQLHYFRLSNKRLIINNHFLFWKRKEYDLADIVVINVEKPYRQSSALRVITKDFKSRSYSAGSLRKKHWSRLKEQLDSLAIPFAG